jgi:hypothetical protein
VLTLTGAGCSRSDRDLVVEAMLSPAAGDCAEPMLMTSGDRLYLSWLRREPGDEHVFEFATWGPDGAWSPVRQIHAGTGLFANWADVPSVAALDGGEMLAHWLTVSGPDKYAYHVMLSRSADGIVWDAPTRAHDDSSDTEHGFVTLHPDARGAWVIWLDGQDYATAGHDSAEMSLRARRYQDGALGSEVVLDTRTCDCCPTAAVRTDDGLLVAYRDRSDTEVRDISLVRCDASGNWSEPYALARDGWEIAGCPVNGPALDASGQQVAACWFTMAGDVPAVHVAFSSDGGRTFGERIRVDTGEAAGRTDVVLLPSGEALAVWLQSPPEGAAHIMARRVTSTGRLYDPFVVARTSGDRASGFPRAARLRDTVYFAWTSAGEAASVEVARLRLPAHWQ